MAGKALRARKKAGSTAMPLMARVAINLVAAQKVRVGQNILLVVPPPVPARSGVRANHGEKKLKRRKPMRQQANMSMG